MGFWTGVKHGYSVGCIKRFCRTVGWQVEDRDTFKITVYIPDPLGVQRPIIVNCKDAIVMGTCSFTRLRQVPHEVAEYLLTRNDDMLYAAWSAGVNEGHIIFSMRYVMAHEGLTEVGFLAAASEMAQEAGEFDSKMQRAGLLE